MFASRVFSNFKLILNWHSMLWQGNRRDDLIGHLTSVTNFCDLNNILCLWCLKHNFLRTSFRVRNGQSDSSYQTHNDAK